MGTRAATVLLADFDPFTDIAVASAGPGTCAFFPRNVPHAWKSTGSETGRVLFMYTPAGAGGYLEEMLKHPGPLSEEERDRFCTLYRWEIIGPNPL